MTTSSLDVLVEGIYKALSPQKISLQPRFFQGLGLADSQIYLLSFTTEAKFKGFLASELAVELHDPNNMLKKRLDSKSRSKLNLAIPTSSKY